MNKRTKIIKIEHTYLNIKAECDNIRSEFLLYKGMLSGYRDDDRMYTDRL